MKPMKPFVTVLNILVLLTTFAHAQSDANTIINTIIDNQRGGQSGRFTVTMTVFKPDKESSFTMTSVSDGNDRSLIQVIAPPRDAGQAFLTIDNNLWLYNPRLKRSLRLPPSGRSDSFLGSDISYNDLAGRDLQTDYTAAVASETAETITLELTPKELAPTPYGKIVITADAQSYAPLEQVYFDQRDQAVRRISFANFVDVDGAAFPTHIEVENLLREGERTVVDFSDYAFGIEVPESCFSQEALASGCQ